MSMIAADNPVEAAKPDAKMEKQILINRIIAATPDDFNGNVMDAVKAYEGKTLKQLRCI